MSLAYHERVKTRRPPATAAADTDDAQVAFHALQRALAGLSDEQVCGLIRALIEGLVFGMISDVAARADEIVDTAVEGIIDQIATATEDVAPDDASSQPTRRVPRGQDAVKRTCVVCGRVGSRRFVPSGAGWRCAPSATKCVGHRRATSIADAPQPNEGVAAATKPGPERPLRIIARTPGVTAQCQNCTRTWTLTGEELQAAIDRHEELKPGHVVIVYDNYDAIGA